MPKVSYIFSILFFLSSFSASLRSELPNCNDDPRYQDNKYFLKIENKNQDERLEILNLLSPFQHISVMFMDYRPDMNQVGYKINILINESVNLIKLVEVLNENKSLNICHHEKSVYEMLTKISKLNSMEGINVSCIEIL